MSHTGRKQRSHSFTYAHTYKAKTTSSVNLIMYCHLCIKGYSLQGDWKKALELYDTVVERRPGDDDAAVSTAVFPPSNSQKVYHQVARGLRKAGEIEELAKFMLRSSSEGSDSSSSQL